MRAWLFFIGFNLQRQARARLMVWVSLGLLSLVALLVHLNTRFDRWNMGHWRVTVRLPEPDTKRTQVFARLKNLEGDPPKIVRVRYHDVLDTFTAPGRVPLETSATAGPTAVAAAVRAALYEGASLRIFTGSIVVGLLASFLLPLWTLTFATETLGRAREDRTLTWLLLRPLSRSGLYLAGYLTALPWCLALNLGGYAILCLLGGDPGRRALPIFALPILLGTLAFAALYQLLSVTFRRAGILGLVYAFFFETIAGNLPGQQKRLSISYYVRSIMVERAHDAGLTLDLAGTRPPVSGAAATTVLLVATVVLILVGVLVFARKEYVETAGN